MNLESPHFRSLEYVKIYNTVLENKNKFPDLQVIDNFVYKKADFSKGDVISEELCWKLWNPRELTLEVIKPLASHCCIAKSFRKAS